MRRHSRYPSAAVGRGRGRTPTLGRGDRTGAGSRIRVGPFGRGRPGCPVRGFVAALGSAAARRRWRAFTFLASLLLRGGTLVQGQPDADFKFRCVLVEAPSTMDRRMELPDGLLQLPAGGPMYVEFWATDSGTTNTGITCAFVDLEYPESCTPMPMVMHSSLFNLFPSGADNGSTVDEFGGCQLAGDVAVEPEWARIGYIQVTPEASCQAASFALRPASSVSSGFGRGGIPTTEISYGTCGIPAENGTVPATSEWGLTAFALCVLTAGTIVLRGRRVARSAH